VTFPTILFGYFPDALTLAAFLFWENGWAATSLGRRSRASSFSEGKGLQTKYCTPIKTKIEKL
jgi:hypothetical protein